MASRKQSFQCFDTTTDDPPLKPPFHHGHCSARSFRGSSGSTRLEPLEDRGCYLCDDHQQAKMMASEASGACSNPWCTFQTHPHAQQNTNRRPVRPEEAPGQSKDHHHHHHHRHSRKIVLVKNSDPSVRRTIVLHRRSLRSMALFMDEVSELMHCLIRKLYTLQGHKIDSVHSLLQCPNILVCVGREPFHPLLLDSFRKNSYDKLPRLNIKSCSSVCSDEKGAKKNVNFGLETKRSAIHPRSDSSNRSGFEKLFPNRLNSLPPGHRGDCPHTGENMDDDIEKRVLVNQDGSLSMEMKVRFRLLHNETLHWSTEVKKSKSSFNESHVVPDDACFLSHGSAESCSEADSLSAGEADETYSTKYYQKHFEQPHCQHCCAHCNEYDIWKNPKPPSQRSVRRIRSSSSSASSRRIVCKKASTDSMRTMSSEEYTEHIVEKATRIQQTIGQQGDTTIEQCTINHCCSRSEVRSMSPKTKSTSAIEDKRENTHASDNDENRPDVISSNLPKDQLNVRITHPVEEDERSVSVVSCSSQILASLKEDHDDEDADLPLSISRASCGQQEDEERKDAEPNSSCTSCKSPASLAHLSPRPPSKASSSGQSKISRKFASPQVGDEEVRTEACASPKALPGQKISKCVVSNDIATLGASESNEQLEDVALQDPETEERALSAMSAKLNNSTKSMFELSAPYENGNAPENTEVNDEIIEERSSSAISGKSNKTNVSEVHDGRAHSAVSIKTYRFDKSRNTEISGNVSEEQTFEARTSSAMSVESNTSVRSKLSENSFDELAKSQVNVEERAVSAVSSKSNISVKSSQSKEPQPAPVWTSEERIEEKASSVESGTLNKSGIEDLTSDDQTEERVHSSISIKSNISARSKMSIELSEFEDDEQGRAPSSVSIKSFVSQMSMSDISEAASLHEGGEGLNSLNTSVKLNAPEAGTQVQLPGERSPSCVSSISNISKRSRTSKISEADQDEAQEKEDVQERASSTISVKSTASARSRKSKKTPTPRSGEEMKERVPSGMSIKSNVSLKSNRSKMEEEETENRASSALSVQSEVSMLSKKSNLSDREQLEERATSAISAKTNVSVRSKMSEVAGDDDRSSAVYAESHTSETSNECRTSPKKSSKRTEKSPDNEERAPSTLSTKSNNSSKSKKSKVSDMAADIMAENRDDLRSASVLSAKSNISAKSVKTVVSEKDQTDERPRSAFSAQSSQSGVTISDGVEVAEERALSAMSFKSNASERLESNNLKSALPRGSEPQTEERAQSALSARSNVSTRSNKSKISVVLTEHVDTKDQEEERALSANSNMSTKSKKSSASSINVKTDNKEKGNRVSSAMSGRSDISTKTSISAKSTASKVSEVQAEEPNSKDQEEERASSALSARSNFSTRSNKSRISDVLTELVDTKDQEEERALSANSNMSTKSKKSSASSINVKTDNKEKGERVSSAMSGRSDISTKTSISAKSTASKVSEVQAEEPDSKDQEEEDRASSALSARSNVSTRFHKSRISDVLTELVDPKDQEEERASSALSAKSNISAKSKMSNASETDVNTVKKEKGNRVPSATSGRSEISTKTSISAKSTASKVSEVQAEEPNSKDQEEEDRASSALSARSNFSTRSNKSRISDVLTEVVDANDQEGERASSVLSAKSNVSAKSKMSNASATDVNTDNNEKGDRVPSALSGRSDISNKTSISAKSSASKVLEGEAEEPDSKDQEEERVSSALSAKSNISAKSKMSNASATDVNNYNKEKRDRVPSAMSGRSEISTRSSISRKSKASKVSEVQAEEPDDDNENKEKAPSVSKSRISVRSNKSKHSEKEEVQNPDRPSSAISIMSEATPDENEVSNEGEIQERAPRSRTSEVSEIIIDEPDEQEVERAQSSRSLKSDASERSGSEDPVNEDKQKEARTESALSSISYVSARSNKSEDSELISNLQQRAPSTASDPSKTSARSKRSNISGLALKETGNTDRGDIRSSSAMSAKSCASEKSKYSERTAEDDGEVSDQSKVSQSEVSNKYVCGAINNSSNQMASPEKDSEHEEVPESPFSKRSAKSKISSVSSASERVLTPTSTSVSIGIVEDHDVVEEIDEGTVSMTLATSESPLQITSKITQIPEERPQSFASAKSSVSSKSKPKCSHCGSTFPRDTNHDIDDVASNKSSKTKNLNTSSEGKPSDNGPVSLSSLTEEIRPSSKASAMTTHTEITGQEKTESPDVTHESQSVCSKCSSSQEKRHISSASAISDSEKSKTKEGNTDRPKSNISSSSSHLKVHGQKKDVKTRVVNGRNDKLSTKSTQKIEDNTPRCHSATLSVTSGNQLSPIPPKSPRKSKKPVILLGISNDSILSQNVPAPDPREEHTDHLNAAAEKSKSCRSDTNVSDVKSEKSSKCRKRIGSDSSCHKKMDEDMSELSPACLPNASPTEVVNEWLRKIPLDTVLCDLDDEFHDNFDSIEPLCTSHVPSGDERERETLRCDVTKLETQREMEDAHGVNAEAAIDKKSPEVAEGDHSQRGDKLKMFDSSVLVMKVLLSPKLDRCNSLPEVSPVYGRKLSTSAQGLLDCLANLQLLDFGSSDEDVKKEKYQELMSMLKSLWLCDPKDSEKTSEDRNNRLDKEFKARSSSGVDVNSGSTGSGKSSVNDAIQVQTNTECEGLDILTKVQEVDETVEEEASETSVSKYNSATPDLASQAQCTPETTDTVQEKLKDDIQGSDETIRNNDSPRELIETPLSSNKSSGNNNKEAESDHQEDTSSGSATTQHRVQLSKRLSQDPDPLWVLNLLNKLEKQFMTNYVDAMAEFKVRWNLDDNEQLDTMIGELQDEVSRRIQLSINRELRKIQGRAGRPRPPKETISRESTIQTEQRRRRLKVMRNQSIDPQPAKSDDDYTMTGTDFSDQRSDDEYCPCDTCLKKKMASKHVLPVEMLNSAPVMMDFDLRRILQIKKLSPTNENIGGIASESMASKIEVENLGLQAVKEEDEGACKEEVADIKIPASSAQEVKEEYEKQESEKGGDEDNASSTYIEDSSVQSITFEHLRKDVDEVVEIAEMSDNTITAQHKAAEQDEEQKKNDETDSDLMSVKESVSSSKFNDELDKDVENDDISEFDDIMQAEATKEHTEEEPEEHGETTYNETAKKGKNAKTESIEDGETTGEETVEQTAEALAAEEDDIAGNETAEDGQFAEAVTTDKSDDKTTEGGVESEGETVEEVEKAEDKTSEDGQTAEAETAGGEEITEDETAEDGEKSDYNESVEDEQTAGEDEITDGETAEEGETAAKNKSVEEEQSAGEDEITEGAEDGEISANNASVEEEQTAEEDEITEGETAEDGETVAKNESVKDGQTAEDESAEEGETASKDESAEEEQTTGEDEIAEDETAEEGETSANNDSVEDDQTAEEDEITGDETAEYGETAAENESVEDEETTGEDEIAEDEIAEDGETVAKNESVKDGQTAEDEIAEDGETVAKNESVKDGQTAEDESAEDGETASKDESVENEQTAEDESAEEGETSANNESVEDGQTAEDEIAEDGETASKDESVEDEQTAEDEIVDQGETSANNESIEDGQTGGEDEITGDETAEDSEKSANNESLEDAEGQTMEDGNTGDGQTAEKSETVEEHEMSENESAAAETAGETDAGDENTANEGTSEAETEISKEKAIFEHGTTAEDKNAQLELADQKQTPDHAMNGEETDKSQSDAEKDKESVSFEAAEEGDVLSNLEDTKCLDVLTNVEVVEDETPLMNKGDVVLDSVEDKEEESEKEENYSDVKVIANTCGLVANNGESAEAGDEAEDDTEPDMETDEEQHDGNAPALQTVLQSKQINDHLDGATSFNDLVKLNSESEDGADADGEDSETEEHSQVVELSSESEGKSQKKNAYKSFKVLVHTLKFLKLSAATQPESREEDNEHEAEDKETPEHSSDDAEEHSCLEKDEVEELNGKEEGKLSDITEDTAEEEDDQTNETHDNSKDSEWESSENALQKQMTKSSLESQPGSFEEVHEELTKNKKGSNHLQANS